MRAMEAHYRDFIDLYRTLPDLDSAADALTAPSEQPEADEGIYRLGFASMQVHGLPGQLQIGRVQVHRRPGRFGRSGLSCSNAPGYRSSSTRRCSAASRWGPANGSRRTMSVPATAITLPTSRYLPPFPGARKASSDTIEVALSYFRAPL